MNLHLHITNQKVKNYIEVIYLTLLSVYIFVGSMNTTMFEIEFPYAIYWIIRVGVLCINLAKIGFLGRRRNFQWIAAGIVSALFGMVWVHTGYDQILDLGLFMVGAYGIDYRKILKVCFWIGVYVLIAAVIGSFVGLARDLVPSVWRNGAEMIRHSYGIIYPTDFAAHVFFLLLIGWVVYGREHALLFIFFCVGGVYLVYSRSGARNSAAQIGLLFIVSIYLITTERISAKWISQLDYVIIGIIPMLAVCSLLMSWKFDVNNSSMVWLDEILSNRIGLGNKALQRYGIRWFGQFFTMQGAGGVDEFHWIYGYDFVDSSFVLILLQYGALVWFSILLLTSVGVYVALQEGQRYLAYSLVMAGTHSVMEHHYMDMVYNGLFLVLFAEISKERVGEGVSVCKRWIGYGAFVCSVLLLGLTEWVYSLRTCIAKCEQIESFLVIFFYLVFIGIVLGSGLWIYQITKRSKGTEHWKLIIPTGMILLLFWLLKIFAKTPTEVVDTAIEDERLVLESMLEIDELEGVYVDDYTEIYQGIFPRLARSVYMGNAMADWENPRVLVTSSASERRQLERYGYLYTQISKIHGLYTNSDTAINRLRELGYTVGSYQTRQYLDFSRQKLPCDTEGLLTMHSCGTTDIYLDIGEWYVGTRRLEIKAEILNDLENATVTVEVWAIHRTCKLAEYEVTKEELVSQRGGKVTLDIELWFDSADTEVRIVLDGNAELRISEISWYRLD